MRSPFDGKLDEPHCLGCLPPNGYSPPTISNSRPPRRHGLILRELTGNLSDRWQGAKLGASATGRTALRKAPYPPTPDRAMADCCQNGWLA
jgi:hypothetical protein